MLQRSLLSFGAAKIKLLHLSATPSSTITRAMSTILFRQLFDSESSTYTYLLADHDSKEALLIDPVKEQVKRDLQLVQDLGLRLVLVVNTHVHADHITGSGEIKKLLPDIKSGISAAAGAKADIQFAPDATFSIGQHVFKVLPTPGHTLGCVTYYTASNSGMAFTGDALLVRGCGRTDFQGGSAESLYDSVHNVLFKLPRSTTVWPAHDYKGQTCSSIDEEVRLNPRLTKSKEEFIEIMNNLGLPTPKKMDVAVPANLVCGL